MRDIGIDIVGTEDLREMAEQEANANLEDAKKLYIEDLNNLSAHVIERFQINRDARENSGIEDKLLDSGRAYKGEYSATDATKIEKLNEPLIYMNITATKCRVAKSWITDIALPANEKAWMLSPSPLPELPEEMARQIEEALQREFEASANKLKQEEQNVQQPNSPPQAGAPTPQPQESPEVRQMYPPPKQTYAEGLQQSIITQNRDRRELKEALMDEIDTEARSQIKVQEKEIEDQLQEGCWDKALREFIQDFVIYQTAFIKGPIVTKKPKITYRNGQPVVEKVVRYINKRVSPFDIYPAPNASCVTDGDFIEHLRLSAMELQSLRGVPGYNEENIKKVLSEEQKGTEWLDEGLEVEKDEQENKDTSIVYDDEETINGLHYWGPVKASILRDWGVKGIDNIPDGEVIDVEIILAGNEVIKAQINKDPMGRRPYYFASYVEVPGSIWGRSLPEMMESTQRMCNATARAIGANMGMSSGPQIELYVDRVADNGDIDSIYPRKIWQVKSDMSGGSGRAVQFYDIPSNAKELLEVYREFEARADDVTGIPRYAYGADPKSSQNAMTVGGLSMMLESSTKIIKDSIRAIDSGIIKPRLEVQFYQNILKSDTNYTGDVFVIPKASAALTIKAAQNLRKSEFLQITANPVDQEIIGPEARVDIIRDIAEDLGFDKNIIPSSFKTRQLLEERQRRAAEQQPQDHGLEVAKLQTASAERVSQMNAELKQASDQMRAQLEQMKMQNDQQIKQMEMQVSMQENQEKLQVKLQEIQAQIQRQNQEIAVKLRQGSGI